MTSLFVYGNGIFQLISNTLQILVCIPCPLSQNHPTRNTWLQLHLITRYIILTVPLIWRLEQPAKYKIKICVFDCTNGKFRPKKKKEFKGHVIAGYACRPCFSPDQSYLCSGDGEGKMFIWDWKNGRLYSRFRAHDQVVIDCKWLPHETSKENFNNYSI